MESPAPTQQPATLFEVSRRWVVIAFAALILGALGIRLMTFERYLPVTDYTDENVPYIIARSWRGLVSNDWLDWRYGGYPPAYVQINIGVQELVESLRTKPWTTPPEYFFALRLLAVFIGTATVLVVASIGWQLAGPLAGWFAGLIWAFAPVIVEHNSLAIPDPFVYITAALAVTTALRAWRRESPVWLFASVLFGILAIYLKLWPIHTLIPWGIVTLILLRRNPRRMLPWVGLYAVIGLAAVVYLFGVVRPLEDLPAREIETFNSSGLQMMLIPSRNLINWGFAVYPIGDIVFYGVLVSAALATLYSKRRGWSALNGQWVAVLLLYSVAGILMASTFTQARLEAGKIRHVLPVSVVLFPLWGAGVVLILRTVRQWAAARSSQPWQRYALVAVVPAIIGIGLIPYYTAGNMELVQRFQRTDMRSILWHWTDANVPMDGLILVHGRSYIAHTWNREWSGYDGSKPFEWWIEDETQITSSTLAKNLERNLDYFAIDDSTLTTDFNTPEAAAFLDQLTLIKTFPAGPDVVGNTVYFYRMAPPQHTAQATFGDQIRLVGYDAAEPVYKPGAALYWRPYWRVIRRPASNYSMFVHIYPENSTDIVTQYDGEPTSAARPTLTWDDTNELYIGADVTITLPADLPPGQYRMAVGLYDYVTGERLKLDSGDDFFTIPITVQG